MRPADELLFFPLVFPVKPANLRRMNTDAEIVIEYRTIRFATRAEVKALRKQGVRVREIAVVPGRSRTRQKSKE